MSTNLPQTTAFEKPQIVAHVHKSIDHTVYQAHWIPSSPKFVVLGCTPRDHGTIEVYELCRGEAKPVTRHEIATPIKCGTFGATSIRQRQLATGNFKGRLHVWDLERLGSGEPVLTYRDAHDGLINHIDGVGGLGIGEGAAEIVTAGRDGRVRVWDPRQANEPVATMSAENAKDAVAAGGDATAAVATPRDCWAVAFGNAYTPQERCVAAGYDNGDIKLFDLRVMKTRWSHNVKNGVCALEFDRRDICMNKLVATTLESKFFVFDMRTQHEQDGFAYLTEKAHRSTIWCAKHLPQNRDIFMTAGGSGTMCLWKYNYPSKRVKNDDKGQPMGVMGTLELLQDVAISQQPICHFSWSPDKIGLGLCSSFDQSVNVVIVTRLNTV